MNKLVLFAFCFFVAAVYGSQDLSKAVKFRNCKSEFRIKRVVVTPCESPPSARNQWCPLVRGATHSISVTFIPTRESQYLNATIRARLAGMEYPYALEEPDVCQQLECPLQANQEYTYTESIKILPFYPKQRLFVIWSLVGDKPEVVTGPKTNAEVCFIMMAKVADRADVDAMNSR